MPINRKVVNKKRITDNELKTGKTLTNDITRIIGYKCFVGKENFLKLTDDSLLEMLQVSGIGINSLSSSQVNIVLDEYLNFLRTYLDDVTFISSLYPVETETQELYWKRKYNLTNNPKRRMYIDQEIKKLQFIHAHRNNQEYTMFVFGKDTEELHQNIKKCINWSGSSLNLSRMNRKKKEYKLFQINNMNNKNRGN